MSSKQLYKRFLDVVENWTVDQTKHGRDYAVILRHQFVKTFSQAGNSPVPDPVELERKIIALEKIAGNKFYNETPKKRSSSTGLEIWACTESVSTDSLEQFREQSDETLLRRLTNNLSMKFLQTSSSKKKKS